MYLKNLSKLITIGICTSIITLCSSKPKPVYPIPEPRQIDWQKMETYAFIHFGPNTFLNQEWGYGDADPKCFNPTNLDCDQWASTLKKAGMKGVILTAKHHDGYCLWQTKYTNYGVAQSPWKNGKGDVVKELSKACKKYGLKFAVYLSPWDRHQANYGSQEYVKYFHNQLKELLTNYGPVFEVWLDGANGGDGWYGGAKEKRQIDTRTYYQPNTIKAIVDSLQPQAIIFSDNGPGCRWVGNEKGYAGQTNWSLLRRDEIYPGAGKNKELNMGHENGTDWVPAECDVSVRPGWFYNKEQDDKVRSVNNLMNLYYNSVGRNGCLLLNIPVDRTGRIPYPDSVNIVNWRKMLNAEFSNEVLKDAKVKASNVRGCKYKAKNVLDDNYDSYWATKDGVTTGQLTFTFDKTIKVNRLLLQEYIPLGQRVKSFNVEYLQDGAWHKINFNENTTTIGYKRLLRFNTVECNGLRINFTDSKGPLVINNIKAYYSERQDVENSKTHYMKGYPYTLQGYGWAEKMQDRNDNTYLILPAKPICLDLGEERNVSKLSYVPDQDETSKMIVRKYEVWQVDKRQNKIKLLAKGEFSNIENNPIEQVIKLDPTTCRFILFVPTEVINNNSKVKYTELNVQ